MARRHAGCWLGVYPGSERGQEHLDPDGRLRVASQFVDLVECEKHGSNKFTCRVARTETMHGKVPMVSWLLTAPPGSSRLILIDHTRPLVLTAQRHYQCQVVSCGLLWHPKLVISGVWCVRACVRACACVRVGGGWVAYAAPPSRLLLSR